VNFGDTYVLFPDAELVHHRSQNRTPSVYAGKDLKEVAEILGLNDPWFQNIAGIKFLNTNSDLPIRFLDLDMWN